MSTISPGIGKCGDNIYDHRREEERVSGESIRAERRRVVASDDQNWPRNYDRRAKEGDTGNAVGIWEIGLGRFGLRCGAVNVLKRTKEG